MIGAKPLLVSAALFLSGCFGNAVLAGERVQLQLKSGRVLTGCVHQHSSLGALCIESQAGATKLVRAIPWTRIGSVGIQYETGWVRISANEARSDLANLRQTTIAVRRLRPAESHFKSYAQQAIELLRP